jgi:hypothetical protein
MNLGEAGIDNRNIGKVRQIIQKTLRCKRCLVLTAFRMRSRSVRKGAEALNAISGRITTRFGRLEKE